MFFIPGRCDDPFRQKKSADHTRNTNGQNFFDVEIAHPVLFGTDGQSQKYSDEQRVGNDKFNRLGARHMIVRKYYIQNGYQDDIATRADET